MRLNTLKQKPDQAKLIRLIVLFNTVGLIGFIIPFTQSIFMALVPWHLTLMGIFIGLSHDRFDKHFLLFFAIVYIATFFAEWTGVHTGLLFGHYHYGKTMGRQLWQTPLVIGITWFMLIYSVGVLMQRTRLKNMLMRVVIGAALMVFLDLLIEPIATRFDYWQWHGGTIPFKNYWGWYVVSVLMLFVFEAFRFKKQGHVAPVLLLMQFVFFGVLNLAF